MEEPLAASGCLQLLSLKYCHYYILLPVDIIVLSIGATSVVRIMPDCCTGMAGVEMDESKRKERKKHSSWRRNGRERYTRVLIWGYVAQGRWIMLKYISRGTQTFFKSILSLVSHILWPYWKTSYYWQDLAQGQKGEHQEEEVYNFKLVPRAVISKRVFNNLCYSSGGGNRRIWAMGHRPIHREDKRSFINGRMRIIKDGRIPAVGKAE